MEKKNAQQSMVVKGIKQVFQQVLIRGGVFLCTMNALSSSAQMDCSMPGGTPAIDDRSGGCGSNNPDFNAGGVYDTKYSQQEHWIPDASTPEITIPVAIHIFQDALGQGTFTDVAATHATLAQVMGWANQMFQDGGTSSDPQPWQSNTTDSKVNFLLEDRIFFYPNTGLQSGCDLAAKMTYVLDNFPERMKYLGIFSALPQACGQYAWMPYPNWTSSCYDADDMDGYNGVHMALGINEWNQFSNAVTIAHELAHCLDLNHLYNASCPESCVVTTRDYLMDVFGPTPPVNCLFGSCSGNIDPWAVGNTETNNIMNNCDLAWPELYWISDLQAGRFHRALAVKSVKDYALDTYTSTPLTITQDETWNFEMRLYQDVVVEVGATLTLQCILEMPSAGRIIVKPGARLIIDGGRVTTARYSVGFWQGIQAWGSSTQHQYGSPIPTYQAIVILKNGGVVEHALVGVQTQNPDAPNGAGGVVQVQGGSTQLGGQFLNCKKAVDLDAYQNFNQYQTNPLLPNYLRSNRTYFNYCDFIVDDAYRGGDDFVAHVDLWKVDGLRFNGCHWKNLQTTITESDKLGQGILSLDAQYTVSGACTTIQPCCIPCPEANLIRSSFIGLDHGIDASVSETDRSFLVSDCTFEDNVVGVYSRNVNTFQVLRSNIKGGGRNVTLNGQLDLPLFEHRGVFTSGGHGFRIEENNFALSVGAVNEFAGAWVNNSGEYNDVVYKNTATNCIHGFIGEGKCLDPTSPAFIGYQMLCNTNSNPTPGNDIWDKKVVGAFDENFHSIRTQQGSQSKPAGNVFTLANPPWDASDFRNSTEWPLNYWYRDVGVNEQPLDVTVGWVGTAPTSNANTCPTNFTNGHIHPFTTTGVNQVKSSFNSAKQAYISTAYTYNALLNGGNTDQLINEVEHSWPEDAWELHNELMARSPYVSEDVLRRVITRNTLPQAMLLEVLLANPDATKQNGFIKWAQYDAPYPLPQYMIDLIVASWDQRTFRTQLESSMGQQHADMSVAASILIGECKADTTGENPDSTLVYWKRVPSLGARYSETLTRLQRGQFADATTLMSGLETRYKMTGEQLAERDNALAYISAIAAAHQAGHDLMHLSAAEQTTLEDIAAVGCDRPSQWAQNILCYGYGRCTSPCTGGAATQRSLHLPTATTGEAPDPLTVYPNPANTYATAAYRLEGKVYAAAVVLRSVEGSELKRYTLTAPVGQALIDTRAFAPGTYSLDLVNDGNRIATERLVIKP